MSLINMSPRTPLDRDKAFVVKLVPPLALPRQTVLMASRIDETRTETRHVLLGDDDEKPHHGGQTAAYQPLANGSRPGPGAAPS